MRGGQADDHEHSSEGEATDESDLEEGEVFY